MNDKTDAILREVEEKTGMKLSDKAREKLTDRAAINRLISKLTAADMTALMGALRGPEGVSALAENDELIAKIRDALED